MLAAVAMYRKLGFQEVVADPIDQVEGLLFMELLLTPTPTLQPEPSIQTASRTHST